ncbi:MAG: Imm51 family immunity protein [Lachnospiraceae bacterium]|nr:Imm51 family immunity protein [Lachnospiraceae bacterium]
MELLKRDYLTLDDDGENICMLLDTSHEAVREVGQKMSEIRPGLEMDGKGWEAFLKYYLNAENPALLSDLRFDSEGDICKASYKKMSGFTRAKGVTLGKYVLSLLGEASEKGLYCVIRDEGDYIDWK